MGCATTTWSGFRNGVATPALWSGGDRPDLTASPGDNQGVQSKTYAENSKALTRRYSPGSRLRCSRSTSSALPRTIHETHPGRLRCRTCKGILFRQRQQPGIAVHELMRLLVREGLRWARCGNHAPCFPHLPQNVAGGDEIGGGDEGGCAATGALNASTRSSSRGQRGLPDDGGGSGGCYNPENRRDRWVATCDVAAVRSRRRRPCTPSARDNVLPIRRAVATVTTSPPRHHPRVNPAGNRKLRVSPDPRTEDVGGRPDLSRAGA